MVFILDRLKEKFKDEDEEEEGGFDDMNYIIGNSSAMDVGEFPTPMDERIGYASMIGGKVMELQITNPSTFELEGDKMIKTINQLGLDITTHPDMNAGFCTAEKSARGEEYGYDTVEQYFTDYLQELAYFKKRVESLGEGDETLFNIGRMNPHISTSPMPALEERMANDVGVDPFGFEIAEMNDEIQKLRNHQGQNIWENEEFLRRVYYTFFVQEVDFAFQYYGMFMRYSSEFEDEWEKAQREATNQYYRHYTEERTNSTAEELGEKASVIRTAQGQDRGIETVWFDIIQDYPAKNIKSLIVQTDEDEEGNTIVENVEEVTEDIPLPAAIEEGIQQLQTASLAIKRFEENPPTAQDYIRVLGSDLRDVDNSDNLIERASEFRDQNIENIEDGLKKALDTLWTGNGEERMSIDAKIGALNSRFDIEQRKIQEVAYQEDRDNLEDEAEKVFMGEEGYFDKEGPEEGLEGLNKHQELLKNLMQNFKQELWKESKLFYYIIPAWMSQANQVKKDEHEGWKAPEFIWETLVEQKWSEDFEGEYDLDLTNPEKDDGYFEALQKNDEFRMDVAAAVGACYAWGHYTQRKAQFDLKGRDFGLEDNEAEEVQNEGWTWVKWMNKFGLGVNLETMQGSPQMRFKIWRPKDIAVTAHAINLTAREQLDEINEELDGCPAKFTIDMEHVATMGAPPLHEMELFWKQEGELAKTDYELQIDSDKPIAKILRQMHLMDPGVEGQRGTHHGAFERGNEQLYNWLYEFVKHGFARNENEPATVLFELAEHNAESSYMMRITMDLIQLGVEPDDLDPARVDPSTNPDSEEEALIGRFYGIERENYTREWAKIEEHAFDPLKGLLEADDWDYTYSSNAAVEQGGNRPNEWKGEEYK